MGLVASFLGGLVVGVAYFVTQLLLVSDLHMADPQWPIILYGGVAGLLGSMLDSFLGAHMQYSGSSADLTSLLPATAPTNRNDPFPLSVGPQALTTAWGRWWVTSPPPPSGSAGSPSWTTTPSTCSPPSSSPSSFPGSRGGCGHDRRRADLRWILRHVSDGRITRAA